MKKWLSMLLCAAMLFSLSVTAAAADTGDDKTAAEETAAVETAPEETEAEELADLPQVGDTVEGFTVIERRAFPLVGAGAVLFEHERTGARLMYIANNDTNRVFDLTFFTRAVDNTGLPHVFEHSTLDGSEKYPSKALFFNLIYQTYNTFMNALTYPLMTTYPVASLSEEQLLKYADYYTDSCLHPTIMTDEGIFREEAWRYRMADADADLTIEGTVYSEMKGAIDLDSAAYTNMLRAAFPGSTIGNISGGDPEFIPDMTWESLRAYHDLYYHPSNCLGFLYGEFEDYTAFLKLLDQAFAPFEKREFTFEDEGYQPLKKSVVESVAFPVEEGSNTENAATIYYAFLCPGLNQDAEAELVLNTLTDLLIADASPLMQSLKKALPSGTFGAYIETQGPEDAIIISASHVDSKDAALFKKTVDSVLNMIAKKGFEQDLVDSVMASLSMDMKLSGEGQDVGVGIIENLAYYCASDGDEFSFMDYVDALGQLDDWNAKGMYKDAVSAWLVKKPVTALVTTYPQPGLQEELDAAEAGRLAAVKAAMSPEEIKAVVDATNAPEEEDDSAKYVAQLQAVSVSSLPEEIRSYEISDETGEDGVRRLTAQAGVDGVGQTAIFLDASGLPQDDIHWFALYTALLGQMDTDAHTQEELAALTTRYLYNGQIRLSLVDRYGTDEFKPFLRAGWIAADEDLAAGYDLVKEILYRTSFDDAETLLGLIQKNKANLKSGINNNPYSAMLYRAFGNDSPLYAYYNYYSFLDLYAFLEEVEKTMESDPGAVAEKLTEIQSYFRNRTNAVAVYAGSAQGIETNAGLVDAFMADLEAEPVESVKYDFPKCADSEALIVDGSVQFNGVVADFDALGKEYTADLNALSGLVTDMYLYPMLRDQYGVYGVLHAYSDDAGTYVVSYRDPNVTETFDVFEKMPGFVKDLELDQETLDGYILSSYAEYAKPDGELSGAVNALLAVLSQEPADLEVQYMRQLKTITPEKVREYADMYENMLQKGIRFTAGSASAVNANADLYDKILNPFGAVDTSEVEFSDAAEGSEHYDAVRFVFEERLMAPAGETEFGVDTEATVGELAGALNVIIEGDMAAQEEALQLFASYGIVPGDWKITDPLTGKNAQRFLENFSQAVQAAYTADKNAADAVLTRGELAEVIMAYCNFLEEQFAE